MEADDRDIDLSIQLTPVDEPTKKHKRKHRLVPFLLITGAITLSVAAAIVAFAKLVEIERLRNIEVTVTRHREASVDRSETVAVFGAFDAIEVLDSELPAELAQERESITAFLHQVESQATEEDDEEFRKLVDFNRFVKRIELTGSLSRWTSLQKRQLRSELMTTISADAYWSKLVVAGVVAPNDDPNSRIVYVYAWDQTDDYQSGYRLWLYRDGDSWKLYDWEQLDLGLSKSQEWGYYCKYFGSHEMKGYESWAELVSEGDQLIANGGREAAKEKLRLAEKELVPSELQDFCWALTGLRWVNLNEYSEAERCYRKLARPDDTPGIYFSLLICNIQSNPLEALKYAGLYEAATGPSPALLESKARLLQRLNRKEEAVREWVKLLRIQPDSPTALAELFLLLPKDEKSAFYSQLARLPDPVSVAVSIAPSVGYRDYQGLVKLVNYLEQNAPGTSGTLYVTGFANNLDGRYLEAAELYRRAYDSETDSNKRETYLNEYLSAAVSSGGVVEAVKSVLDPKAPLQSLFYSYDEGDIALTDGEYRQLVEIYSKNYPNELDGFDRQAQLAIKHKQYEDAERILRHALQQTPNGNDTDEPEDEDEEFDETEYYRDLFADSLANVLRKQGRLKEAYEIAGDREQGFSDLARQAIFDERWSDVRLLVEMHRENYPDDAALHCFEGELAAHEKRWGDAIRHLKQGLSDSTESSDWRLRNRVPEIYIESGRWIEYYKTHADAKVAFNDLARKFQSDENWDALNVLIAEHRNRTPYDLNTVKQEAEAAWERQDYAAYAACAEKLLRSDDVSVINMYERSLIENRWLSALLRSNEFDQALDLAQERQRKHKDSSMLAIVNAATGNVVQAKRFALESAMNKEDASQFYQSELVGHIFLSSEWEDLQREFPVTKPYGTSTTLAVFLFDRPRQLETSDISAALTQLGINTTANPQPLATVGTDVSRAFALQFDKASVWLASGEGKFNKKWELDSENATLAAAVNNSQSWLAVGTAAWTETDHKQVESLARRLASQIAGDQANVICTLRHDTWGFLAAFLATPELIRAWQSSANLDAFKDQGVALENFGRNSDVMADRQFERSLRDAVRVFETPPYAKLEVWGCTADNPALDVMRLDVTSVRRHYGSLVFDGTLGNPSALIPQLKVGLPMRFSQYEIRGWRLNDETPVVRP